MYAYQLNSIVVMAALDVIIPESNKSRVDISNNSALTYAANNKWRSQVIFMLRSKEVGLIAPMWNRINPIVSKQYAIEYSGGK